MLEARRVCKGRESSSSSWVNSSLHAFVLGHAKTYHALFQMFFGRIIESMPSWHLWRSEGHFSFCSYFMYKRQPLCTVSFHGSKRGETRRQTLRWARLFFVFRYLLAKYCLEASLVRGRRMKQTAASTHLAGETNSYSKHNNYRQTTHIWGTAYPNTIHSADATKTNLLEFTLRIRQQRPPMLSKQQSGTTDQPTRLIPCAFILLLLGSLALSTHAPLHVGSQNSLSPKHEPGFSRVSLRS